MTIKSNLTISLKLQELIRRSSDVELTLSSLALHIQAMIEDKELLMQGDHRIRLDHLMRDLKRFDEFALDIRGLDEKRSYQHVGVSFGVLFDLMTLLEEGNYDAGFYACLAAATEWFVMTAKLFDHNKTESINILHPDAVVIGNEDLIFYLNDWRKDVTDNYHRLTFTPTFGFTLHK